MFIPMDAVYGREPAYVLWKFVVKERHFSGVGLSPEEHQPSNTDAEQYMHFITKIFDGVDPLW
jgi:hypothetical protein